MDPLVEQLHTHGRERMGDAPSRREFWVDAVAGVSLIAVCAAMWVFGPHAGTAMHTGETLAIVVALAVCLQVKFSIGLASTTPLQVALVPLWFAVEPALIPLFVAAAGASSYVAERVRSRDEYPWGRMFISLADSWFAVGPALVFMAANPSGPTLAAIPVCAVALFAQFLFDGGSSALRAWLVDGVRPTSQLELATWMWKVDAALAPVGLLLALAVATSPWALLLGAPIVWLLGHFAKEHDDRILKALELSHAYRGTAQLMGDVLEADDAYTGGEHTNGVVQLSLAVGAELGLSPAEVRDLEFGALLHDIGKLRVPNEIINKPGKLTEAEWAIIRRHPEWGQEMLNRVGGVLAAAGVVVRAHHERWDGGGYPDGLEGEEIPIAARIITACDSFSAMTTDRAYRRGMALHEAVAELEACSGSQFDPVVVEALRRVLPAVPERPTVVPSDAESIDESVAPAGRPQGPQRALNEAA